MNVLQQSATRPAQRSSGPTIYGPVFDQNGDERPAVTSDEDERVYRLAQSASGEPCMVSATKKVLGDADPIDAVNARNVERYRIDAATRAIDAARKGDDDAATHAETLRKLVTDEDHDDAATALVVLDALDSLDAGAQVSALAEQRDSLGKARKGLPDFKTDPTVRVARGLMLYGDH